MNFGTATVSAAATNGFTVDVASTEERVVYWKLDMHVFLKEDDSSSLVESISEMDIEEVVSKEWKKSLMKMLVMFQSRLLYVTGTAVWT